MIIYVMGAVMFLLFLFVTLVLINPPEALVKLFIKPPEALAKLFKEEGNIDETDKT